MNQLAKIGLRRYRKLGVKDVENGGAYEAYYNVAKPPAKTTKVSATDLGPPLAYSARDEAPPFGHTTTALFLWRLYLALKGQKEVLQ